MFVLINDFCLELLLVVLVAVPHWMFEQCKGCSQHLLECRTSTKPQYSHLTALADLNLAGAFSFCEMDPGGGLTPNKLLQ